MNPLETPEPTSTPSPAPITPTPDTDADMATPAPAPFSAEPAQAAPSLPGEAPAPGATPFGDSMPGAAPSVVPPTFVGSAPAQPAGPVPAPQMGAAPQAPPANPSAGLAIASMVLGILGLLSSAFVVGGLLGLIAVILGVIALIKRHGGKGMSIAGIATGAIAILVGAFFLLIALVALGGVQERANEVQAEAEAQQEQMIEDSEASRYANPTYSTPE